MSTEVIKSWFQEEILDTVFNETPSYGDLLKLVAVMAVFMFLFFQFLGWILDKFVVPHFEETFSKVVDMEFDRFDKQQDKELFNLDTKEKYNDFLVRGFMPKLFLISFQHLVGGMLAVPSVLGMNQFSISTRNSLACLGIITEMGWEAQDTLVMFFVRIFGGEEGKKKFPILFMFIALIHHSLASGLGLPAIMNFRDLPEMHRLCFDLQLAGATMLAGGEMCRPLDVTKKKELHKFLFFSVILYIIILWTRLFDWFYIVFKLLILFYTEKNWTMLVGGILLFSLFSFFNFVVCIIPMHFRITKFIKKAMEFEAMPADADEAVRRSTVFDLQMAASEFIAIETRPEEIFLSLFEKREIERRHSVNPGFFARRGSTKRMRPHRQSMMAWREMPSRVKARAGKKDD